MSGARTWAVPEVEGPLKAKQFCKKQVPVRLLELVSGDLPLAFPISEHVPLLRDNQQAN